MARIAIASAAALLIGATTFAQAEENFVCPDAGDVHVDISVTAVATSAGAANVDASKFTGELASGPVASADKNRIVPASAAFAGVQIFSAARENRAVCVYRALTSQTREDFAAIRGMTASLAAEGLKDAPNAQALKNDLNAILEYQTLASLKSEIAFLSSAAAGGDAGALGELPATLAALDAKIDRAMGVSAARASQSSSSDLFEGESRMNGYAQPIYVSLPLRGKHCRAVHGGGATRSIWTTAVGGVQACRASEGACAITCQPE